MRPRTPPRLRHFDYVGPHRYFLTICTYDRRPVFRDASVVDVALRRLLERAGLSGLGVHAYCFMPDHMHAVLVGERDDSQLLPFIRVFKQTSGYHARRCGVNTLWQAGWFERVLRDDESTLAVVRYVLENPVRAGLTRTVQDYPFSGSGVFTMAELMDAWRER